MQGLSEAPPTNFFPSAQYGALEDAYTRVGIAEGMRKRKKKEEEKAKKKAKKRKLLMGGILAGAALASGGAALLAAPAAAGVAGGLGAAGGAAGLGGTAAAGAGAAGAAGTGGFLSGLSTFGQGVLSGLTGSGSVGAGIGGVAKGLSTAGSLFGRMGTSMLAGELMSGGGEAGGDGGGANAYAAAGSALTGYLAETAAANKTARVFEGALKDPAVRSAVFGPGFNQEQSDAVMKYASTLGAIDKAAFYQSQLPMIAKQSANAFDFQQQMKLAELRNQPEYARGIASMITNKSVVPRSSSTSVDFSQFGGLPSPVFDPNYKTDFNEGD